MKKRFLFLSILSFVLISSAFSQNNNFELGKNLDIFSNLYRELHMTYVDEIEPGELMKSGIDGMLEMLDPYTVYIPESEIEDYQFMTTGEYGGIGALIHKQGEYVLISEPYENFPAHKAGLKAGDRILSINGQDAIGKQTADVSKVLKGQAGTTLDIVVERDGLEAPIEQTITREIIKIDNIPYFGMLNDHIGYIKLTSFTKNAGNEVKKAFQELKELNELNGIIIDLRSNGGGLMNEAVDITNIFVRKNQLVVSTRGKLNDRNQLHKTKYEPIDREIPLVVLVNEISASASEIVAGAIQDLDRGVIIGQRTFGKGLVQNVVPLSYNSKAKITIAKYYIPSGRCIQAIDYSHKDDDGHFTKIPDSLITEFETKNGRKVYDGGGIIPDISLTPERLKPVAASLLTKFHIFNYATYFEQQNESIAEPSDFTITDEIYDDFLGFMKDKDYSYTTECEKNLKALKKNAKNESFYSSIEESLAQLEEAMNNKKENDLIIDKEQIQEILKMEIISRYYYQKGKILTSLETDPEIEKAINVLEDPVAYNKILKPGVNTNTP